MRSVLALLLLVGACTWIGLLLFNVRGYGERLIQRAIANSPSGRRSAFNLTGASAAQVERYARATFKVVLPVMFVGLLTMTVFFVLSLLHE